MHFSLRAKECLYQVHDPVDHLEIAFVEEFVCYVITAVVFGASGTSRVIFCHHLWDLTTVNRRGAIVGHTSLAVDVFHLAKIFFKG